MTEQARSKRPKRLSARRNPEAFLYALSWQEERDIQRAMYKSLKESRGEPLAPPKPEVEEEEEELEEEKKEPVRKSPRLHVPVRPDGVPLLGANGDRHHLIGGEGASGQEISSRPLLMRASSSPALEDGGSTPKGENSGPSHVETSHHPPTKKRILAPRRSMGEIPVELWVDPNGKPVVTRDFLDFLCFRSDLPLSSAFPSGPSGQGRPLRSAGGALPSKLAWFELPPQERPQAKLFTTGPRGSSEGRNKVAARDKRTSVMGGLISDSSSNSGGSTGLSRRNSGQSSPSGEDNAAANLERRSSRGSNEATARPRKKSRSLFYQIMTAKLRRLQSHSGSHKRHPRPQANAASVGGSHTAPSASPAATTATSRAAPDAAVQEGPSRRSTRVQALAERRRHSLRSSRSPTEAQRGAPVRRSLPAVLNGSKHLTHSPPGPQQQEPQSERTMVTRQHAKDILLRAKTLRRR